MIVLWNNKRIKTDRTFDVVVRDKTIGINEFVVSFMNHGSENCQIIITPTCDNDDIKTLRQISITLSYADGGTAQADMEAFFSGIYSADNTIFDTEAKDIKYVYGKRPKEDIKYITERFTIVKTKVYGTFLVNSENEDNMSNGIGIFTRRTPTRLTFNSEDEDFVPAYRQEEIITEIYGPMNFVYSMSGVSELWNYIRLHPAEIEDIIVIEDGKISHQTGHIATKEEEKSK